MASPKRTWRTPVRKPGSGGPIYFWANTATLRQLQREAAASGRSVHRVAKDLVDAWAASQQLH